MKIRFVKNVLLFVGFALLIASNAPTYVKAQRAEDPVAVQPGYANKCYTIHLCGFRLQT
ncbi:MAG: hypothetical protein JETT_1414 [Candidatus Jettenia ecosi]|uniref:Uncharacterized protein n=1 Tax=Candidatus Jettenia ecosi TaxID=2494326 RepID=A0A533QCV5_9BACT|nr:MAG: hypothetical protein JETT_1414 [Candidatus Jettenia ecosi]